MTWLLMLILCASIFSWSVTIKYQEEIDDLKKKHNEEIGDYRDTVYELTNENIELQERLDFAKRR